MFPLRDMAAMALEWFQRDGSHFSVSFFSFRRETLDPMVSRAAMELPGPRYDKHMDSRHVPLEHQLPVTLVLDLAFSHREIVVKMALLAPLAPLDIPARPVPWVPQERVVTEEKL